MKKISMLAMGLMMMASCATAQDIQLPAPDMNVKMTLMETLQKRASQREYSDREISDATLSQVLWAACGINRPESKKITAPSAINAQDILLYVARKDGAYLYEPQSNTLKKICNNDLRCRQSEICRHGSRLPDYGDRPLEVWQSRSAGVAYG